MSQRKALDECRTGTDFRRYVEHHPGTRATRQTGSHLIVKAANGSACVPVGHGGQDLPTGTRRSVVRQLVAIGLALVPFVCAWLALQA